ncbi:uncharacterized protein [Musca autumnalis]|uniref:uncharacterized protein n=1 Tax=Musca autumnalis TaxID=221902 RepID=UPI003CECA676
MPTSTSLPRPRGTSNGDICTVRMEHGGSKATLLSSIYMPFEAPDPPNQCVRRLLDEMMGTCNVILGCDANAHHFQWGSKDTNKRGESIFDFILSYNLRICNRGSDPTFKIRNREEVIDLTLSNLDDSVLRNWRVSKECSFSDHMQIFFDVSLDRGRQIPYRNPRRTNWDKYTELTNSQLTPNISTETVDDLNGTVKNLTDVLLRCHKESCPLTYPGRKSQPVWWSKELGELRKNTRRLYNRAHETKLDIDWDSYKVSFNKYKSEIKRAKKTSLVNFCESVEGVNDAARFRRLLSKDPKSIGSIKKQDGAWTDSATETLDLLAETHFPGCKDEDTVNNERDDFRVQEPLDLVLIDRVVNRSRIKWAVSTFKPYKSPGPDLIPNPGGDF